MWCISTSKQALVYCSLIEIIIFRILTSFYIRNRKKQEKVQKRLKLMKKGVYQHFGATPKCWLTPKCSLTHGENIRLSLLEFETWRIRPLSHHCRLICYYFSFKLICILTFIMKIFFHEIKSLLNKFKLGNAGY